MTKKPYVVVAGTDFSKDGSRALEAAYAQACRQAPAELHVVHTALVVGVDAAPHEAFSAGLTTVTAPQLGELQEQLLKHIDTVLGSSARGENGVRIVAHVAVDVPSFALTHLGSELEADLLVVGAHGLHGFARWILGSTSQEVVRSATCPVLVIPPAGADIKVPEIEPPCPRCVAARRASSGSSLWCEQHSERHGRRHTYYEADRSGARSNFPLVANKP